MVGALTVLAGLALLASGGCLAAFFSTGNEAWGRANDATTALWALLMVPAALEIWATYGGRAGRSVGAMSVLAIAGELVIAATSSLTAMGLLDWKRSAKAGSVGFVAVASWMATVSALALAWGGLPRALAWFGLATIAVAIAAVVLSVPYVRSGGLEQQRMPPAATMTLWALAFLCFPAWCIWLGVAL